MARNFETLKVWKDAMALAKEIYMITSSFPREEQFGITSQMRRAAVSIPSNIAEGCSRNTNGEFIHFIGIARGSAGELKTQLLLACGLGFLNQPGAAHITERIDVVGRMLSALKNSLQKTPVTSNQ